MFSPVIFSSIVNCFFSFRLVVATEKKNIYFVDNALSLYTHGEAYHSHKTKSM